jgi:hypothetical protein
VEIDLLSDVEEFSIECEAGVLDLVDAHFLHGASHSAALAHRPVGTLRSTGEGPWRSGQRLLISCIMAEVEMAGSMRRCDVASLGDAAAVHDVIRSIERSRMDSGRRVSVQYTPP